LVPTYSDANSHIGTPLGRGLGTAEVAFAIRLAILAAAFYLFVSIVGLTLQGRWLTRVGKEGVEADPAAPIMRQEETVRVLSQRIENLEREHREVKNTLRSASDLLGHFEDTLREVVERLWQEQ